MEDLIEDSLSQEERKKIYDLAIKNLKKNPLDEQIKYLEEIAIEVDGKTPMYRLKNRLLGFVGFSIGSALTYVDPYFGIVGIPLVLDGISDLAKGKKHSLFYNVFKVHPRHEIERAKKNFEHRYELKPNMYEKLFNFLKSKRL